MSEFHEIGWAIKQMRNGSRACRAGWNGKGMWLVLIPGDAWRVAKIEGERIQLLGRANLPWIGMKTADECFVPWLASQTDLLATDWEIVE